MEFTFFAFAFLFSISLLGAFIWGNLFKKVLCLSVFSNSIIIFYLVLGFYKNSTFPIHHGVVESVQGFTNPLPSVLMLTAIVVGISIQAIAFALVIKTKKEFGTVEEDEILEQLNT